MKKNLKQYIKPVLVSVLFGMLNALSCRLFIVPNGFASSGVEGISVMINRLTGFNLAYIQLIFNVPLCIFAFFCVDKKFSVFTVIYSLIYSLSYLVFDNMDFLTRFEYRALGEDTIYPVLVAGVVSGAAYGFLFKENSSSGGVDTLKQERIDRVTDKRKRKAVASMLKIDLDESGDFIIDSKEKASYLIKYLCYKIFKDGETKDILEASTISTLSIS